MTAEGQVRMRGATCEKTGTSVSAALSPCISECSPRAFAPAPYPAPLTPCHSPPARPLRCGTFLAPHLSWLYEFLIGYLSRRSGWLVEMVEGTSYDQLAGDLDLAFVCGLPYVMWAHAVEPLTAPVLMGARYGGQPIYFSDVIVRSDSGLQTFTDLRGRSWAYNEPRSQSGYGIVGYHLARLNESGHFFSRVVEAGWHERALRLVADGVVDAAAIDSHVLDTYLRQYPELAGRLRVIDSLGPSPIQPVVAARQLPKPVKNAVRDILVNAASDAQAQPTLERALIERFIPVDDAAYDPIRAMGRAAADVALLPS